MPTLSRFKRHDLFGFSSPTAEIHCDEQQCTMGNSIREREIGTGGERKEHWRLWLHQKALEQKSYKIYTDKHTVIKLSFQLEQNKYLFWNNDTKFSFSFRKSNWKMWFPTYIHTVCTIHRKSHSLLLSAKLQSPVSHMPFFCRFESTSIAK